MPLKQLGKWLKALIIPLSTLAIILALCAFNGIGLFRGTGSWLLFFRATVSVTLTTFALAINLQSGRFDFSLGSISLLSSVVGATLAVRFNLSPVVMLVLSASLGGLLGLVSGGIYVTMRIPPIIASLGVTLLYEGAAFAFTGGKGVSFVTRSDLIGFASIPNYLALLGLAVAAMVIVLDYSGFGANYRALQTGQKIAVDTGIREVPNALGCYGIAGALMGCVGFISATNTGTVLMSLNFGSVGVMFTAFLPMFIGGYIGKLINERVGMMLGAVTTALISLAYARLNAPSSTQSILSAMVLVLFLIYLNNEHSIKALLVGKRNVKIDEAQI